MAAYDPLHNPDRTPAGPFNLEVEIAVTHRLLNETAGLNIHSNDDMLTAAASLNARLRTLLAAIEAERGETR